MRSARLQMGMVHEVVPAAKLDEAAVAWAEKVSANAPLSLRTMKQSLRRSLDESNDAWHEDILEMGRAVRVEQGRQGRHSRVSGEAQAGLASGVARPQIAEAAERLAEGTSASRSAVPGPQRFVRMVRANARWLAP